MLGPTMMIVPMLLWFLVMGPLVLYPIARWRQNREPYADPHLGAKVALHYFKLLGMHTLLMGGTLLVWTIISKSNGDKGSLYRAAFGLLVPGAIVFGAHRWMIEKTNDDVVSGVRRLFLGYNLLVTGLIGFTALLLGFQALFAKGSTGDAGRMFLAAILVYGGAWGGIGLVFSREVFGGGSGMAPPQNLAPPSPPPPMAQGQGGVAATPGLPSLGSAYPPIAPRGSE